MIKENRVNRWALEAYQQAVEKGIDMVQATAAIEEIKSLMQAEVDPFIQWKSFDSNIGKTQNEGLMGLLEELRAAFKEEVLEEEREWLASIDLGVPLVWNSWLRKLGKALVNWRIDLCKTLLNVGAVPLEKQIHTARLNEKILLLADNRYTEGYAVLKELASYDCLDSEDRVGLLLMGAGIWLHYFKLPEEALSWISEAKKIEASSVSILDTEGLYFLSKESWELAEKKCRKALDMSLSGHLADLHLGDICLETGELSAARSWYEKGLNRIPGEVETYLRMIRYYARQEHKQRFLYKVPELAEKAAKIVPDHTYNIWVEVGNAFQANGLTQQAINWYKKAESWSPKALSARLQKGQAYLSIQEYEKAEDTFHELIDDFPKNYEGYGALAWSKEVQGSWSDAIAYYEQGLSVRPQWDISIRKRMAEVKLSRFGSIYEDAPKDGTYFSDILQLEEEFIQLFKEDQEDILLLDQLDTLANMYLEARELNKAIQIYEKIAALAERKTKADYENRIGNIYYELGDFERASEYYHNAIAGKPNEAVFYANLGLSAEQQGDIPLAKVQLGKALNLAPDQATYLHSLGLLHLQEKEIEKAIYFLTSAVEKSQRTAAFHANLGLALRLNGRWKEAETHLGKAISLMPSNPEFYNNLGLVKEKLHEEEEALAAFRQAVELTPDSAPYLANLGQALARVGEYEEAESSLLASLKLVENQPEVVHNLGLVYTYLSRYEEACERLEEALHLSPDNPLF
ncbi:MAG: tetratricopeptide repeat protein, partial [Bacteroidota bacterium]